MGPGEIVISLAGIIVGAGFLGFVVARITGLIKAWIDRKKTGYDEETFNRLAKAFMQYKKDTERRLQNLEAIIAEENPDTDTKHIAESHTMIDIETEDEVKIHSKKGQEQNDRKLRNMLKS